MISDVIEIYLELFIYSGLQSECEARVKLVQRVWDSLPLDLAMYFSKMDKDTFDDEFFIGMRNGSYLKLSKSGLQRVGDVVALSEAELREHVGLTHPELSKVVKILGALGLSLGMDVAAWREYRSGVPEDFRLSIPYGRRLPKGTGKALLT